ncbi:DDE_3 domain-containing protein [Trichonephila clavipes]|nr:DDE_3 domain-containing protein [Trichonephila clavipes]
MTAYTQRSLTKQNSGWRETDGYLGLEHVEKTPSQTYDHDYLFPTVKYGSGSIMICENVSWFSARPIVTLNGSITGEKYRESLDDQVHLMKQSLFTTGDESFHDDNAPIYAEGLFHS